jgi:argininosuccinate lyase
MAGLVRTMRVQAAELARQSVAGFTLATEAADWLAKRGVPFASAHEITGALVKRCEELGVGLAEIGDTDLVAIDHRLTADIKSCLTPEAAVAARVGYGGTAPVRVREQLDRLTARLDAQRRWVASYGGPRG